MFRGGNRVRILVGLGGLEPPTSPLSGVRSNHLSYRPNACDCLKLGGADRDRTDDPLLAKQVLSQLSYSPVGIFLDMQVSCVDALGGFKSFSKGGDPAAPSDTATLLRLHPSHEPHRGNRPPEG